MSRIHLSLPNAYKLMCCDRNINGNRDVKFLIGIIGQCTDRRKLLQLLSRRPFIHYVSTCRGKGFRKLRFFLSVIKTSWTFRRPCITLRSLLNEQATLREAGWNIFEKYLSEQATLSKQGGNCTAFSSSKSHFFSSKTSKYHSFCHKLSRNFGNSVQFYIGP